MRRAFLIVGAALVLGGCTPEMQLASQPAYSPEWCNAAKSFSNNGNYLFAVAQCHERGVAGFPRDEAMIDFYYTEAVRRGHVESGARLASRGQPIPDDDLRREAVARAEAERNRQALISAVAPRQALRPQPPVVNRPTGPSISVQRENRSTSTRRNCTNNVCRTETTTCVNGRCTTTVTN
ncbi:MAG: hypothetical protein MUF11_13860 [Beijerinckiaceae bacterium]|jgi:hypothetical protein|nr:hypothetical protein [Beijerinckiaceae bacterium]